MAIEYRSTNFLSIMSQLWQFPQGRPAGDSPATRLRAPSWGFSRRSQGELQMCPTNMSSFGAKKRRQKLRALVVQWPQKLRLTEIQRKFVQVQSDSKKRRNVFRMLRRKTTSLHAPASAIGSGKRSCLVFTSKWESLFKRSYKIIEKNQNTPSRRGFGLLSGLG